MRVSPLRRREAQLEALLTELKVYGERVEALAALGLDTGLRLSELLRLRWADVGEVSLHVRSDGRTARTKNDRPHPRAMFKGKGAPSVNPTTPLSA